MTPASVLNHVIHPWTMFGTRPQGNPPPSGSPMAGMAGTGPVANAQTFSPLAALAGGATTNAATDPTQSQAPPLSTGSSTSSNIANASNSLASDQTTFLKLLTVQLQNQDPLSPMDTNAFTQQLVAMTGVQQQILSNQLLQQMVAGQGGLGSSVGLIGKDVKVNTGAATLQSGDAQWNYNIPSGASNVTFTVIDSSGNTVYSTTQSAVGAGDHTFDWNGQDLTGTQRPDGTTFGLKVNATAADGTAISSQTWLQGTVSSIQQINGQTVAVVDGTQVPLNLIATVDS